ncbi:MAG TPA: YceI family protein [Alphaproteobacteria bacterium]|nr:polyisoprenoid-binding protein [Alphaproteobacteria bacterium]USO05359.1 MAG: polyisoprenoid-binding protein [Rhodospirillales bacterium]HOO81722.1 YceI family protein [Alphaproteobacteria bacterium]
MSRLSLSVVAAALLFVPASVQAQVEKYSFDKAHTQILFFVNHLGFSNSQGEFHDYDGSFTFDQTHPENSSVDVTIQSASIDMDDEKWDEHLKTADFFAVEKFPTMHFKSTDIEITGDNSANITGDLTLLGVTHPVTLAVVHNKSDKHPFSGKYVSGFSGSAILKRSDFGMNYGIPGVADEVQIRLEVEGIREEQEGEGTNNP